MKLLLYLTLFVGVLAAQVEPMTEPEAPAAVIQRVESAQPVQSTVEERSRTTGELPLLGLIGLLAMTSVLFLGRFQS